MIRRVSIISILLSLCFCNIFAEDNKEKEKEKEPKIEKEFKPEWNIGVGFGTTFSSIDFHSVSAKAPTKNMQQFVGGVAVRYLSNKSLGMIAELNYSQQGWEGKFENNPEFKHKHKLNYLELPILTHINFGSEKFKFFFNLGPKISFLLSESEELNDALANYLASGNVGANEPTDQYYRKADKKFDYGILIGLGVEWRTKIGYFNLEGRYNFGFGDIYKNTKADYFDRSANRVIGAKLTYYVKLF